MQTVYGQNEALLTCREAADGLCLARCETADADLQLPDEIGGRPVTVLGDYALSARAPAPQPDDFSVRLTCGGQPPAHDAAALRTVTLPRGLTHVGSYAFYNCTGLTHLTCGPDLREIGGGALMNCRALRGVTLLCAPDAPSALQKLLGEYAGELDVCFVCGGRETRLLFPAYDEVLEDLSPAHIFQRRIHGAGYAYRQCFERGALLPGQYDRALTELTERHDFDAAARVAVRRLATPFALTDAARAAYLDCLRAHGEGLACALAARGDSAGLTFLLSLDVVPHAALTAACDAARKNGQTAALSVLLARTGGAPAPGRAKRFDL